MFKLVLKLLALAHLLAVRETHKQNERQKQFRKAQAAKAEVLRAARVRAQAKADALHSQAATANAKAALGSNEINLAITKAASLASRLEGFKN